AAAGGGRARSARTGRRSLHRGPGGRARRSSGPRPRDRALRSPPRARRSRTWSLTVAAHHVELFVTIVAYSRAMRGKLSLSAAVLLLAVAGVAAAAANAAVAPVWLAPAELTARSDYSIVDQKVAVDPRDNLLALWSGKSGVQARFRPAGRSWQDPVTLASCGVDPTAAFDAAGNATVAWLQCTGTFSQMTTAVRRVDGTWSSPVV